MKQSVGRKSAKRKIVYPDRTKGGEFAAEVRQEMNGVSDEEREELLKQGMRMIYGDSAGHQATRARH
jgi:hypothetical protein